MADGAKGISDVAGEAADIGAFGDVGGECDFIKNLWRGVATLRDIIVFTQRRRDAESLNGHGPSFHLHDHTCPR